MEGIVSPYLYLLIYPLIIFDKTNINLLLGGKKSDQYLNSKTFFSGQARKDLDCTKKRKKDLASFLNK
jgi:hypothetical protein